MSLVYVIRKKNREQPVSDYLLLEEALYHWKAMGYGRPEYYIEALEGPDIIIEDGPIDVMYLSFSEVDFQEESNNPGLDMFSFTQFTIGGEQHSSS
jgi:hypothetical protein